MEQNLKELFEKDRLMNYTRSVNHEDLFIERLYEELPLKNKNSFGMLKIAASVIIVLSLGIASYVLINQERKSGNPKLVLSTISPDLKEIEDFYVANINSTLLEIKNHKQSQSLIDRYMKRFAILKDEHRSLIIEINTEGPSTMSINALINNLKKQLELLQDLKIELEDLKNKKYEII